jgi:hypothetical protein
LLLPGSGTSGTIWFVRCDTLMVHHRSAGLIGLRPKVGGFAEKRVKKRLTRCPRTGLFSVSSSAYRAPIAIVLMAARQDLGSFGESHYTRLGELNCLLALRVCPCELCCSVVAPAVAHRVRLSDRLGAIRDQQPNPNG